VDQRLAFKAQKLAEEKGLDLATAQTQVLKEHPNWPGSITTPSG